MGFLEYIKALLLTAIWNPDSVFFSAFSWVSATYAIVFFLVPSWRRKMVKYMGVLKRFRWVILIIAIFLCLIFASYTLQNTRGDWQKDRPFLSYQEEKTALNIWSDDTTNTSHFDVYYPVENTGNFIAYNIELEVDWAPTTDISNTKRDVKADANPILPNSSRTYSFHHSQYSQKVNGQHQVVSTTWYVRLQISYSDALDNGHHYSETYWIKLDYNIPNGLRAMTQQESEAFKAVVGGK